VPLTLHRHSLQQVMQALVLDKVPSYPLYGAIHPRSAARTV